MTTQVLSTSTSTHAVADDTGFVRRVLRMNALFVGLSGFALIAFAQPLADWLGSSTISPTMVSEILLLMGLLFLPVAALTWRMVNRPQFDSRFGWLLTAVDLGWGAVSLVLLLTNALALSTGGNWFLLLQADVVLTFGILEMIGMRRLKRGS